MSCFVRASLLGALMAAVAACARPGADELFGPNGADNDWVDGAAAEPPPITGDAGASDAASGPCDGRDPLSEALCKRGWPSTGTGMNDPASLQDLLAGLGELGGVFAPGEAGVPRLPFGGMLAPPSASECAAPSDPLARFVCGLWQDGGIPGFGNPFARPPADASLPAADGGTENVGAGALDAGAAVANDAGDADAALDTSPAANAGEASWVR